MHKTTTEVVFNVALFLFIEWVAMFTLQIKITIATLTGGPTTPFVVHGFFARALDHVAPSLLVPQRALAEFDKAMESAKVHPFQFLRRNLFQLGFQITLFFFGLIITTCSLSFDTFGVRGGFNMVVNDHGLSTVGGCEWCLGMGGLGCRHVFF